MTFLQITILLALTADQILMSLQKPTEQELQ